MRNFKLGKSLLASAIGVALLAGVASPSGAATTADTTATFTVTAGLLAITAPASKALSNAAAGGAATAQLGTVTVDDARGALAGAWTATASTSAFTTTGEGAPAIPASAVSYWSGAATATTGTATFLPGQLLDANKVALDTGKTAFSAAATVGNNTAAWNPTVIVTVPAGAVAGAYTGTITHSVA